MSDMIQGALFSKHRVDVFIRTSRNIEKLISIFLNVFETSVTRFEAQSGASDGVLYITHWNVVGCFIAVRIVEWLL
jgi:hypothetical protein